MRATLNIPDKLVREAQEMTGAKTKTETIVIALEEVVRRKKLERLIALGGKLDINYDWETEEAREVEAQQAREDLFGQ
jgi:hypothetical protein